MTHRFLRGANRAKKNECRQSIARVTEEIWLKVIESDLPQYLLIEAAEPAAQVICGRCRNTGVMTDGGEAVKYCFCDLGFAAMLDLMPMYMIGDHCRQCFSNFRWCSVADMGRKDPVCAFCVPVGSVPLTEAMLETAGRLQLLTKSSDRNITTAAMVASRPANSTELTGRSARPEP